MATGMEGRIAQDSCAVVKTEVSGKVASVTGERIVITKDGEMPEGKRKFKHDPEAGMWVYVNEQRVQPRGKRARLRRPARHDGRLGR